MIEIRHLRKEYEAATPLEDVSFTIEKGDSIAVIGPSGTGKSTLLRCINLLERPTSGQILVDGEDITDPACDLNRVRRKLGMVFQSFNLYEHLTVVENCMLAQTLLLKRSRQEAYDRSMALLASVEMDSRALQYPGQLSGGQKQRAAIARTLATDPEIILFDEPTSALDPLTVGEVEKVIRHLAEQGCTMMTVTHSMEFARSIANRVFYMDGGGIYEEGTPEQIFDAPRKERTRKFVRRLDCLEMTVTESGHDLYEELGRIYAFCEMRKLEEKRIVNTCRCYEECYNLLFRQMKGVERNFYISLEYDAPGDRLSLCFTPCTPPDMTDREAIHSTMEYKILRHYVRDYRQEQSDEGIGLRYTIDL